MDKSADAFRTISEAAEELDVPQHVLRFWETRFPQIKPLKRAGGRRYYRPRDIELLRLIKHLLYCEGYTIKGVLRVFNEQGAAALAAMGGASDKSAALSLQPEQRPQDLANSPPWQDAEAGMRRDPLSDSREPPILPDPADLAPFASKTASRHKGPPPALAADGVLRLQAALVALAECEEILEGACRVRTSN
jgi:DNA-binding transcriptional MerR regulator